MSKAIWSPIRFGKQYLEASAALVIRFAIATISLRYPDAVSCRAIRSYFTSLSTLEI